MNMVDLNGKTILVTGGCGFIGSNFIEYVKKSYKDVNIVNIDKLGVGSRNINAEDVQSIYMDMRDMNIDNVPKLQYDFVFHFAAESHVDRAIASPSDFISNNVMGITALLEYVKVRALRCRVVNVSTDEVYGYLQHNEAPFTEKSNLNPRRPYSASKAVSDFVAKSYCETYSLDIVTTRCCNNYGPHQNSEKYIPAALNSLKRGEKIKIYGNGSNIREWIYVIDHIKSILEITELGESGKVYNIGSSVELTNLEMARFHIKLIDIELEYSN